MTATIDSITINSIDARNYDKEDINLIINKIDNHGICVVQSFVTDEVISALDAEFMKIIHSKNKDGIVTHAHPINKNGKVARCKKKCLDKESVLKRIFSMGLMKDVSNEYFQVPIKLNDDIFLTYEKESDEDILPWHFDRQQSLKFYINLLNVNEDNGAFKYDLGSHREGHFRANYYILSGMKVGEIPNDIPDNELHNPVTINAKAGDLVIFDPDGFHKAGQIKIGRERKVIRGHSHPCPNRGYKAKLFDSHWWLQRSINIAKCVNHNAIRNVPNKRLTRAIRTR